MNSEIGLRQRANMSRRQQGQMPLIGSIGGATGMPAWFQALAEAAGGRDIKMQGGGDPNDSSTQLQGQTPMMMALKRLAMNRFTQDTTAPDRRSGLGLR